MNKKKKVDVSDDEAEKLLEKVPLEGEKMPSSFFRPISDYPGHHPDPEIHNIMLHTGR